MGVRGEIEIGVGEVRVKTTRRKASVRVEVWLREGWVFGRERGEKEKGVRWDVVGRGDAG